MTERATDLLIAVIEDDESVLKSMARLLKASGFQSVLFRSAEAFLADPPHPRFDCVIADVQLGGMSGIELRERLALAGLNIPMILMTARDQKELDSLELQSRGATVMRKSESSKALLAVLNRMTHQCPNPENDHRNGDNARR